MDYFRFGLVLLLVMFLKVMSLFGRQGFWQNRSLKQIAQIFDRCLLLCVFINTHALQENVNIDLFVQSLYNMYHHDRSFVGRKRVQCMKRHPIPFRKLHFYLGELICLFMGRNGRCLIHSSGNNQLGQEKNCWLFIPSDSPGCL